MAQGISAETPLEMFYREARAARIYDGPDEAHRMVVARRILREYREASRVRGWLTNRRGGAGGAHARK